MQWIKNKTVHTFVEVYIISQQMALKNIHNKIVEDFLIGSFSVLQA